MECWKPANEHVEAQIYTLQIWNCTKKQINTQVIPSQQIHNRPLSLLIPTVQMTNYTPGYCKCQLKPCIQYVREPFVFEA